MAKTKTLIFSALFIFAVAVIPKIVHAAWYDEICDIVEQKVNAHLVSYEDKKDDFVKKVSEAIEGLRELNESLKKVGCDTTTLETDYQSLFNQLNDWTMEYDEFVNLLEDSQELACGESEGAYAAKIRAARDQLVVVREKGVDMVEFYENTIKPHAEEMKSECLPGLAD